jgi:hypothetical protein
MSCLRGSVRVRMYSFYLYCSPLLQISMCRMKIVAASSMLRAGAHTKVASAIFIDERHESKLIQRPTQIWRAAAFGMQQKPVPAERNDQHNDFGLSEAIWCMVLDYNLVSRRISGYFVGCAV